jgi:hypothetical protein
MPEDVSLVGFDDVPIAAMITPRLSTVRQPARDMGYRATGLLFDLMLDEPTRQAHEPFPTTLQIRDSSCHPPARRERAVDASRRERRRRSPGGVSWWSVSGAGARSHRTSGRS